MMTVVDQVRPWLMPSRTLAAMIQPQLGAQISRSGTGTPMSQPATRTGLRPMRSVRAPAARLVSALVAPKAMMKLVVAVNAVSPKVRVAISGSTVRSWPTMPPTSALTPTRRLNWARFWRSPNRGAVGAVTGSVASLMRAVLRSTQAQSSGPPTITETSSRPAAARRLAAVIARSPWPHIRVTGPVGHRRRCAMASRARC